MKVLSQLAPLALASVVALSSCCRTGNNGAPTNPIDTKDGDIVVYGHMNDYQTRVTSNTWDANDAIGVYAYNAGTTTAVGSYTNVKYTTTGNGAFVAATEGINLPESGNVDVVAYYPYSTVAADGTMTMDLSNQSDLDLIDYMRADKVTGLNRTNKVANLVFKHQFALLTLNVTGATSAQVELKEVLKSATLNVTDGTVTNGAELANLSATATASNGAQQIRMILLPGQTLTGKGLAFTINGKKATYTLGNLTLVAGKKYTLNFKYEEKGAEPVLLLIEGATITDWVEGTVNQDPITINPDDNGTETPVDPETPEQPEIPATSLFIVGGDFEDKDTFLGSLNSFGLNFAEIVNGTGLGYNSDGALHINSSAEKNKFVFTSKSSNVPTDKNVSKVHMYIKGTLAGNSLAFAVYQDNSEPEIFNLGTVGDSDVVLESAGFGNKQDYAGSVDTKGKWVKVTLNINKIKRDFSDSKKLDFFNIKIGKNTNADLYVDNITFE